MMHQVRRLGLGPVKKHFGLAQLAPPYVMHGGRVRNLSDVIHNVVAISKPAAMHAAKAFATNALQGIAQRMPLVHGVIELAKKFGQVDPSHTEESINQALGGGFFDDLLAKGKAEASKAISKYAPQALGMAEQYAKQGISSLADRIRQGAGAPIGGAHYMRDLQGRSGPYMGGDWLSDIASVAQSAASFAPLFLGAGAPIGGRRQRAPRSRRAKIPASYGGAPIGGDWLSDIASVAQSAASFAPLFLGAGAPIGGRPRKIGLARRLGALKM